MFWCSQIDGNGVPGPIRDEVGIQTPTKDNIKRDGCSWGMLWRFSDTFREVVFLMCSRNVSFSPPGRHLGAQGARKGTKMEPKVMKKVDWRHLVEHAITMAGTVWEPFWEVPGRIQETLFSERGAKATPEESREGSGRIFHDLGSPLGVPWGTILGEKVCFCSGPIFM